MNTTNLQTELKYGAEEALTAEELKVLQSYFEDEIDYLFEAHYEEDDEMSADEILSQNGNFEEISFTISKSEDYGLEAWSALDSCYGGDEMLEVEYFPEEVQNILNSLPDDIEVIFSKDYYLGNSCFAAQSGKYNGNDNTIKALLEAVEEMIA